MPESFKKLWHATEDPSTEWCTLVANDLQWISRPIFVTGTKDLDALKVACARDDAMLFRHGTSSSGEKAAMRFSVEHAAAIRVHKSSKGVFYGDPPFNIKFGCIHPKHAQRSCCRSRRSPAAGDSARRRGQESSAETSAQAWNAMSDSRFMPLGERSFGRGPKTAPSCYSLTMAWQWGALRASHDDPYWAPLANGRTPWRTRP